MVEKVEFHFAVNSFLISVCCGLTPASNWAPCSCSLTVTPQWDEWENQKSKVRKLMSQVKDSLVGKAKTAHISVLVLVQIETIAP